MISNSNAGLKSYKVPKNKALCIYNGIDSQRVNIKKSKETVKKEYRIRTTYVIGMVAAFRSTKDYKTFLIGANEILKLRDDVTFVCVGDGLTFRKCKSYVKDKFQDRVIFTGAVKDVDSIVNIFDIAVLCTFTEGISNSIMEYMLLSKPVIATDGGGTSELITDNENGLLIPPMQVADLKQKILMLLNDLSYAYKLGVAGNSRLLRSFSLNQMVEKYTQALLFLDNS
mgnify:CR=1 FL=1